MGQSTTLTFLDKKIINALLLLIIANHLNKSIDNNYQLHNYCVKYLEHQIHNNFGIVIRNRLIFYN